jgi:hypothetical protein
MKLAPARVFLVVLLLTCATVGVYTASRIRTGGAYVLLHAESCSEWEAVIPSGECLSISGANKQYIVSKGETVTVPLNVSMSFPPGGKTNDTLHFVEGGASKTLGYVYIADGKRNFVGTNQYMSFSPQNLTLEQGVVGHANLTISIPDDFPLSRRWVNFYVEWSAPDYWKIFSNSTAHVSVYVK